MSEETGDDQKRDHPPLYPTLITPQQLASEFALLLGHDYQKAAFFDLGPKSSGLCAFQLNSGAAWCEITFRIDELRMSMDDFSDRHIRPWVEALKSQRDKS
jgi:hypothetical protein